MNKKLLLVLQCVFLLVGCNGNENSSGLEEENKDSYQIKIVDIDGEVIGDKTIKVTEQTNVFDDLVANFEVDYTVSDYGPYISSINNSVVDANYYMSIYENNAAAATGVDGLVAEVNDVFEFKVECWNTVSSGYGTLDDYDVLVDKVIYGYMKDLDLSTSTTYADSSFWDLMTIKLAKENYYDAKLFSFDNISGAVKNELPTVNYSTLNEAGLYKYYLYNKVLGNDLTALKEYAETYSTTINNYNYYSTPFAIAAFKGLGISNDNITRLTNLEISNDFQWGPDIPVWQYCTSLLYNESLDTSTLTKCVETIDYGNSCSNSLTLQAFAATGVNVRESQYEVDGKDLIEVLFDNYYNKDNNILEYTQGVINTYSENQTIASLMAYKVFRDTGKKVNIYG